jgi:protein ImuB
MRARRPAVVLSGRTAERLVAALPVSALHGRLIATRDTPGREAEEVARISEASCIDSLRRLGVGTLGELARLPVAAVADRFGDPGVRALRLARGAERPLRPRSPHCELVERLGLSEAASGPQLERALRLLVERLLANPGRAGRSFRRLRIEARLAAGGGWRAEVAMRNASTDAERLLLALAPRLGSLPAPAAGLGLRAIELGPPAADQRSLADSPADRRRGQLAEAVRQVRSAAGRDSVLRVVEVDPGSRVPERRAILSPFSEPGDD